MPKSKVSKKNVISDEEIELSDSEAEETVELSGAEESGAEESGAEESGAEESGAEESEVEEESDEEGDEVKETQTVSKTSNSNSALIEALDNVNNSIEKLDLEFKLKFDKFKKYESTYNKTRKGLIRKQESAMKKISKQLMNVKARKKVNRDPSTIGGFNKVAPVPKVFQEYLGLEKSVEMTRPQVVQLLKAKFEEAGYVDSETKEIRVSNKVLKKFGFPKDYVFKGNRYQSFLKVVYDNEKNTKSVSV
jgi:hypothetical protein